MLAVQLCEGYFTGSGMFDKKLFVFSALSSENPRGDNYLPEYDAVVIIVVTTRTHTKRHNIYLPVLFFIAPVNDFLRLLLPHFTGQTLCGSSLSYNCSSTRT